MSLFGKLCITSEVVKSEQSYRLTHLKRFLKIISSSSGNVFLDECHLFFILCLGLKIAGSNLKQIQHVKMFEKRRDEVHSEEGHSLEVGAH